MLSTSSTPAASTNLSSIISAEQIARAEVRMKQAAIGLRVHSGWTALVAVAVEDGQPLVLWRGRPHLVETFTYAFRQPYHTAEKAAIDEAREIVSRARSEATRLARKAIGEVQGRLEAIEFKLSRCGLILASGRPLPTLEKTLASHSLIHTADGELFRDALLKASEKCGLDTYTVKERELVETASRELRMKPDQILRRVAGLGSALGPPWTQDEKLATLVAWLALIQKNVTAAGKHN